MINYLLTLKNFYFVSNWALTFIYDNPRFNKKNSPQIFICYYFSPAYYSFRFTTEITLNKKNMFYLLLINK